TPAPFPTLETPRLLLRELIATDAPALFAIHGNAEAMKLFGTDPRQEPDQAEGLIEKFASWRLAANPGVRWGLEEKATERLVGTCGLFAWNRDWRKCSTGYELEDGSRGKGLMREALQAAFSWGFAQMALNRIEAQVHPENEPSLELARRLGFRREGLLREVAHWGGEFHDLLQLGLLRRDWAAS
ncbi:MAG: GNAT family protein, partial [Ramlibacter sp.]